MPRCVCAHHRFEADERYVSRIDRGWPRWLAFLLGPPGSKNEGEARDFVAEFNRAYAEGRVGVGFLGSVITDDRETAAQITRTFGLRLPG